MSHSETAPHRETEPIRLLLVDVHAISMKSSRAMLDAFPGLCVVGACSKHTEAMKLARTLQPDVVLISMRVQDSSGPQTAKALLKEIPDTRVIFLTLFDEPEYVRAAVEAGAHGYVLKHEPAEQVFKAIASVMSGKRYFSPGLLLQGI